MLIGIFTDAHGDITAVKKALWALKEVDKIYYLGDICDFVPSVMECIDMLQAYHVTAVRGNCDRYPVIGDHKGTYRTWLSSLPREHRELDMVFVHEPVNPGYAFKHDKFHICFCGHTHRSFLISRKGRLQLVPGEPVFLEPDGQYVIGIGSASRPRGGEDRVAALYDSEQERLVLVGL